ncbi:Uncharacterized conserved protein, DUF58 family, contains vWF domain [Noviherbaspirillum humi]|uniref:Uncharacterized conserved protein, DUF58 family, contains vWF domain n=1 Tax=Noviherbaspirillum humi TaxID=1688639 RepID=A0A239DY04_9BURK|nr:DUF58 domain-containing protein [Noviherbaspirillum humi]SNS37385.1 Uncharacterized conserved protein, DUF58 family, contains vWF domain [Noviherbaspirillum humi]
MLGRIEHRLRRFANRWLQRSRAPEPGEVFLHQRRVYIVPTHPGLFFSVVLIALFIGSMNYNLSLGFAFTFLVAACALIDMHLTFRNLAHLHLAAGRAGDVFAGEEARFELHLINRRRHMRYAIWIDFVGEGMETVAQVANVPGKGSSSVILSAPARERGWMQSPRVRLQTRFPLGLLRAWSYWQPDVRALVYPRPEEQAPPLPLAASRDGDGMAQAGSDDFAGIRNYQAGDSLRRLAWRQIARLDADLGGELVTKHFEGTAAAEVMLDLQTLPAGMDLEARLSRLTRWVLDAEAAGLPYALRLGPVCFDAAFGPGHQQSCLQALALYGKGEA